MFIIIVFWLGCDRPSGLPFFVPALLLSIPTPLLYLHSSFPWVYIVLLFGGVLPTSKQGVRFLCFVNIKIACVTHFNYNNFPLFITTMFMITIIFHFACHVVFYFFPILAVSMRKCNLQHSDVRYTFSTAILNWSCFLAFCDFFSILLFDLVHWWVMSVQIYLAWSHNICASIFSF